MTKAVAQKILFVKNSNKMFYDKKSFSLKSETIKNSSEILYFLGKLWSRAAVYLGHTLGAGQWAGWGGKIVIFKVSRMQRNPHNHNKFQN